MEKLNRICLAWVLLLACSAMVHSLPADNEETMMADDDFDYSETDDQALSQSLDDGSQKTQGQNKSVTVTGILRENVTLKCLDNITKTNVVLWYFGNKLISQGNSVLLPNYSLNMSNYQLTIINSSPQNAGDYYCVVEPLKIVVHNKVILGDSLLDIITPESSTSGQASSLVRSFAGLLGLLTAALTLL